MTHIARRVRAIARWLRTIHLLDAAVSRPLPILDRSVRVEDARVVRHVLVPGRRVGVVPAVGDAPDDGSPAAFVGRQL